MLVDDEAIITMQLEKRLSTMGYEVVGVACSGEESVHMARKLMPDLVLMDIVMPGKVDGIDAASKIRSELDIPIIFLTAFADEANINRAKRAEPFGYIVKPFHEEEVRASIEVALHKRTGEKRLRENYTLYHAIMREAFDPIIITDDRGSIVETNKRAEHLLGLEKRELLGTYLDLYLLPGKAKRSKRARRGNGVNLLREAKICTASGAVIPVQLSVSSVSYNGRDALLQIMSELVSREAVGRGPVKPFRSRGSGKKRSLLTEEMQRDTSAHKDRNHGSDDELGSICGSCKRIRTQSTGWMSVESFLEDVYGMDFNHGICSECAHKLWPDMPQDSA
jgi:PAS domain S-box-containing protein